ncbi:uncharacterized protein [Typha latifolia]|uniref:uncharacterized protein n=1 Tax=Typha latifolia TaxID=4733 RepID=UPI003C2E8F91
MSTKSPIFPFPEPHHYSDYGFDPQIDYFQVLEEARRQSKRCESRPPPLDSLHLKLQKPISKDAAKSKKRHRWWKTAGSALLFWKRAKPDAHARRGDARGRRCGYPCGTVSGPLYVTEASCMAAASCRSNSGPLAAAEVGVEGLPYLSLRGLNLVDGDGGAGARNVPIYLVT